MICTFGNEAGTDGGPHHCEACAAEVERSCAAFDAAVLAGTYDQDGFTPAERRAQQRKDRMSTQTSAIGERYARLPVDQIVASTTNPRTHFSDAYLQELARSIAEKGVLQPILVRQVDAGSHRPMRFEIVAGECRYRASKLAGQVDIPAIVRPYTDSQVLEVQLIENLHRTDLTPLEQAAGYRALITSNPDKHSAATIAQRLGMSEAWVWDRLKLNDLVPAAKAILEQERMTIGHAILIARLKPTDQQRTIAVPTDGNAEYRRGGAGLWRVDHGLDLDGDSPKGKRGTYDELKACSVRELESWIREHVRFDVAHAAKAQPLVFEATAAQVTEAAAQPGRGRKVIAITHEYRVADDARDAAERTYGSQSWVRADGLEKSKPCEYAVLGVVVAGQGQGETLQVCINRDKCTVHFGAVIKQRAKNQQLRASGHGAKAATRERKQADRTEERWKREQAERTARTQAWDALEPHIVADAVAQVKGAKRLTPRQGKALVAVNSANLVLAGHLIKKHLGATWFKNPAAALLVSAVTDDPFHAYSDKGSGFDTYLQKVARPLGLDVKRLEAVRDRHLPKTPPAADTPAQPPTSKARARR